MPAILQRNEIPSYGLDYNVYFQLLPLIRIATNERIWFDTDEQAKINAAKLAILFGEAKAAIEYLTRYENRHPNSTQLVHDACLFTLPKESWDLNLWRPVIKFSKAETEYDPVISLLTFAPQIEKYLSQHRAKLEPDLRQQIYSEYELRFGNEFDKAYGLTDEDTWISENLARKTEAIRKEINFRFDKYLRQELKLPEGKLEPSQSELLKNKIRSLSEQDKKTKAQVIKDVNESYRKDLSRQYQTKKNTAAKLQKQDYIKDKLTAYQQDIEASISLALINKSKLFSYQRANENIKAAALFFKYGILEQKFDKYLSLKPVDDPNKIPYLLLDGKVISETYSKFYLKKLDPHHPNAAILGKLTSCCQFLGGQGEEPTIHGICNPNGGFYVLCERQSQTFSDDDPIYAQTWAWRAIDGSLVFDSIETQITFSQRYPVMLNDFFIYAANQLVKEHHIPQVLVGQGGNTPDAIGRLEPAQLARPINYSGYRDSRNQYLIAHPDFPLLTIYHKINNTAITAPTQNNSLASKKDLMTRWIEICCFNKADDLIDYAKPKDPAEQLLFAERVEKLKKLYAEKDEIFNKVFSEPVDTKQFERLKEYFLNEASNINVSFGEHGQTALHLCVLCKYPEGAAWLLDHGANIDAINDDGETPLHSAIRANDFACAKLLVERGADINADTNNGTTVFQYALQGLESNWEANNINWEIVKLLLQQPTIDVKVYNQKSNPFLYYAAVAGQLDIMESLLSRGLAINEKILGHPSLVQTAVSADNLALLDFVITHGANVDEENDEGVTPFLEATAGQNIKMMKTLLDYGANINAKDKDSHNALFYAFSQFGPSDIKNFNWEVVKFLLDNNIEFNNPSETLTAAVLAGRLDMLEILINRGADVNKKLSAAQLNEATSLHYASSFGVWESVEFLIPRMKNIDEKDGDGITPFLHAARNGQLAIAKHFTSLNVNLHEVDNKGNTALHLAVNPKGAAVYTANNKRIEMMDFLITSGVDIHAINADGKTALFIAVENAGIINSDLSIIEFLLKRGANINDKSAGESILHYAVTNDNLELVELCINAGADINLKNGNGDTPLHLLQNNFDMAKLLLAHGANPTIKNNANLSPISHLIDTHNLSLAAVLIEHGADVNEVSKRGKTLLHESISVANYSFAKWFIEHGALGTIKDSHGKTAIDYLKSDYQFGLIELLESKPTPPPVSLFFQPAPEPAQPSTSTNKTDTPNPTGT